MPRESKIFGIGYMGNGPYNVTHHRALYHVFYRMLKRAYSDEYHKQHPTYAECTVVKRWHNFQNFCEDIVKMDNWNTKNYHLDKDLRILGNKKYGPKYCSFVPQEINKLLNTAGFKSKKLKLPMGVSKRGSGYEASISKNGRNIRIGVYPSIEEAQAAYAVSKMNYVKSKAETYRQSLHKEVYLNLIKRADAVFA